MRILRNHFDWRSDFIAAVQDNMLRIAQDAGHSAGFAMVGVWLDDGLGGVCVRLLRESELNLGQSFAWRPHAAFPLDRVASDGVEWAAARLGAVGVK